MDNTQHFSLTNRILHIISLFYSGKILELRRMERYKTEFDIHLYRDEIKEGKGKVYFIQAFSYFYLLLHQE